MKNNIRCHIAPSILSADFSQLAQDVAELADAGITMLHIDVMDGHFVPNITIGPVVVKSLRARTNMMFDVHLMLQQPQRYVESFAKAGSDLITVHVESDHDVAETIALIKKCGKKVGLSLNPNTAPEILKKYLKDIDLILLMTVYPGFGGQSFMPEVLPKVRTVRAWLDEQGLSERVMLEVDGGINDQTLKECLDAGANVFVAGNYIFGQRNIADAVKILSDIILQEG